MSLEVKLIRTIHARKNELGIDDDLLHEMALRNFGKDSIKKLTNKEAFALLDLMGPSKRGDPQRRHAQSRHGRKDYDHSGDPAHMIGPSELAMLGKAAALRGWSEETLQKFSRRQCKQLLPRTLEDFNKVWWALRSMNQRDGLYRKGSE